MFLGLLAASVRADQTNLVQNVGLQLYGIQQGTNTTRNNTVMNNVVIVPLETRRVIQALAVASGNTFSSTSKLVMVTALGNGAQSFQVRDGATTVDVSSYLSLQQTSGSVQASFTKRNGGTLQTTYSINRLVLRDGGGLVALPFHFDVSGFASETSQNGMPGDEFVGADGVGDAGGNLMILQGSIRLFGHTLEVVAGGNGGPGF